MADNRNNNYLDEYEFIQRRRPTSSTNSASNNTRPEIQRQVGSVSQNRSSQPIQRQPVSGTRASQPIQRQNSQTQRPTGIQQQSRPQNHSNQTMQRPTGQTQHTITQQRRVVVNSARPATSHVSEQKRQARENGQSYVNKNNSKRAKKGSNKIVKAMAVVLCTIMFLSVANSIINSNQSETGTAITETDKGSSTAPNKKPSPEIIQVKSLDEVDAKFEFITWNGKQQLTIDDESLKQIIQLALNDVRDFYVDELDSPNVKFEYDAKNKKVVNAQGKQNFYEDNLNWQYYFGRAQQEASGYLMVDFVNDIGEGENNPSGIFQNMKYSIDNTLTTYFADFYNHKFKPTGDVIPSKYDVQNFQNSKECYENIKQAVYNSAYQTIVKDVYQLKSFTINHEECYKPYANMSAEEIIQKYNIDPSLHDEVHQICKELKQFDGKYSPTMAAAALNAMHFYGFEVRETMQNGTFFQTRFNSAYVKNTMQNQDNLEQNGIQME